MFLQPAVAVFMFIWFAGFAVVAGLTRRTGLLSPVAMLIFGAVLVGVGFFSEARQARKLLEQALAAP